MSKAMPVRPRPTVARSRRTRRTSPLALTLPVATFVAVFLWDGVPPGCARTAGLPAAAAVDREAAGFARCSSAERVTCVVDGDTFWYRGDKIRIADINTPETGQPGCAREAALGAAATERLTALLNQGAFTLAPARDGRNRDRYGRLLREVTRDGESLGATLVNDGLAEPWQGRRSAWCGGG